MLRSTFLILLVLNIIVTLIGWVVLPPSVAIHFGSEGRPDGWASSEINFVFMLVLVFLIFLPLYFGPFFLKRTPSRWLSIPRKEKWLGQDGREKLVRVLMPYLWEYGIGLLFFLLVVQILTVEANLSDPVRLREGIFLVGLVIFLGYTVHWTVRLILKLKREEPR